MSTPVANVLPPDSTGIAGLDEILCGGFDARSRLPRRRRARLGQDDARPAVPARRRATRRARPVRDAVRDGERAAGRSRSRTAGRSKASTSASSRRPKRACGPTTSTRCSTRRKSSCPRRPRPSSPTSTGSSRSRVVFDSLSEMRLLAGNPLRYRRQILALKQFFVGRNCTVVLLDDMTSTDHDLQVQSIVPRRGAARADEPRIRRASAGGSSCSSIAASRCGAATTTTSSGKAGSTCFPRLVARSTRSETRRRMAAERRARDRRASRRRPRARHQHARHRRCGHGQVDAGRAVRGRGRGARRARGDVHLRREPASRCSAANRRARHRAGARTLQRAASPSSRWTPPSCRRASSRTRSWPCVEQRKRADRRDRQPQRLPERDARGALPHRRSCTSSSRTSARRAWPRFSSSRTRDSSAATCSRRWTRATSPTP